MGVEIYTYRNVRTGEVVVRPERSARLDSKPDVWVLESEPTEEPKEPKVERVKAAPKAKSRSSSRRSTGRKTSSR